MDVSASGGLLGKRSVFNYQIYDQYENFIELFRGTMSKFTSERAGMLIFESMMNEYPLLQVTMSYAELESFSSKYFRGLLNLCNLSFMGIVHTKY